MNDPHIGQLVMERYGDIILIGHIGDAYDVENYSTPKNPQNRTERFYSIEWIYSSNSEFKCGYYHGYTEKVIIKLKKSFDNFKDSLNE